MCRLYGFRSSVDSSVHASLVAAENALGRQSEKHPDGWGIAYYRGAYPHVIRSQKKAFDDQLFSELSAVVSTKTLIAHVRQATVGSIGILNTHPFQFGPWMFAHNGQVAGFKAAGSDASDRLLACVDPRFRNTLLGSTDSELIFGIFLSRLARMVDDILHTAIHRQRILEALTCTIEDIQRICAPSDDDPNMLTVMVSNGVTMVGFAYGKPLHYSTHKTQCPERESCPAYERSQCEQVVTSGRVKHLVMSSEKINEGPNVWQQLEDGEAVSVDFGMHFERSRLV